MKKILAFLLIMISLVSCKEKVFVRYDDDEFARTNNGSLVVSKGKLKTESEKLVYTIVLRNGDSTWTVYGISKKMYDKYELCDTVKYFKPIEQKELKSNITINESTHGIDKIDITIYFTDDTLNFTQKFYTNE